MLYPREFFAVQVIFALKMAELRQQPYTATVLHTTAFYRILGLDWSFNPEVPLWQEYQAGLRQQEADTDWTYQFYLAHAEDIPEYTTPRWGCFSYEYQTEERVIRMHFSGKPDASGYGPLTSLRREARLADLRSMFFAIKEAHPEAESVQGGSWLYNRREYLRLFPAAYGESASPAKEQHLRARGLWGQFLRHTNHINEQVADLFLGRLSQLRDPDQYAQCFPYQVMLVQAPITLFYEFYGV